jgi:hypothetical protein
VLNKGTKWVALIFGNENISDFHFQKLEQPEKKPPSTPFSETKTVSNYIK